MRHISNYTRATSLKGTVIDFFDGRTKLSEADRVALMSLEAHANCQGIPFQRPPGPLPDAYPMVMSAFVVQTEYGFWTLGLQVQPRLEGVDYRRGAIRWRHLPAEKQAVYAKLAGGMQFLQCFHTSDVQKALHAPAINALHISEDMSPYGWPVWSMATACATIATNLLLNLSCVHSYTLDSPHAQ